MTLDEFLTNLAQTPRTWMIDDGCLRQIHPDVDTPQCPISAVAHLLGHVTPDRDGYDGSPDAFVLASRLHLDIDLTHALVDAADGGSYAQPSLRAQLCAHCGVIEED